jgi:PHD/YefM family antitoxin component YafN of YafNO toxin-antitoxin module
VIKELNVPIVGVSELKRSPSQVFDEAEKAKNGVYILNNNTAIGVVMDVKTYESLVEIQRKNTLLEKQIKQMELRDALAEAKNIAHDDKVDSYDNAHDLMMSMMTEEEFDALPD